MQAYSQVIHHMSSSVYSAFFKFQGVQNQLKNLSKCQSLGPTPDIPDWVKPRSLHFNRFSGYCWTPKLGNHWSRRTACGSRADLESYGTGAGSAPSLRACPSPGAPCGMPAVYQNPGEHSRGLKGSTWLLCGRSSDIPEGEAEAQPGQTGSGLFLTRIQT